METLLLRFCFITVLFQLSFLLEPKHVSKEKFSSEDDEEGESLGVCI